MQAFFDYIATVAANIWGVLTFDPRTADWATVHPLTLGMAITIAVVAGVSTLLGDSAILFLNSVRGWRFALSLLLNGVAFVLLYVFQAVVIALVGPPITGHSPPFDVVVRGVLLSTAPLVFGFLVLIPYLGPAIARALQLWGLVILWLVNTVVFDTGLLDALAVTGIGWGVMKLLSTLLARPMNWLGDRIWRVTTGRPSLMTGRDLLSGHVFMPLDNSFAPEVER
ncbi:MAG: hypothetical protein LCH96_11305 [Actinobacteria bacterium]|nr:hypothetical protein [Actinomycetota bacterium]